MNMPQGGVVGFPGPLERPDDLEDAVIDLYRAHALGLTRLAVVMLGDRPAAEDVVQDAFRGLYTHWRRLSHPAKALPYLRSSVLSGCRNHRRRWHRARPVPVGWAHAESAESSVLVAEEHREVLAGLQRGTDRYRLLGQRISDRWPPATGGSSWFLSRSRLAG